MLLPLRKGNSMIVPNFDNEDELIIWASINGYDDASIKGLIVIWSEQFQDEEDTADVES